MTDDGTTNAGTASTVTVERLPPDEAFGLLGHEIRFGILEALNDADESTFSELRAAVGVEDPGQFNYHLGELVGRFVRETEDGYRLSAAGRRVVGAALSGAITKAMDADAVETDADCLECDESMVARFREDGIAVECPTCGMQYTDPDVPPGVVEGRVEEGIATVLDRWLRRKQATAGFGFCPDCDGDLTETASLPGEPVAPDWFDAEVAETEGIEATVVYECGRCGAWWHTILPMAVLTHPAVMGFHYDHGIDLRETPTWELPWLDQDVGTVTDEDPLEIAVPMELDGERYVPTFDRDLAIVEERRESVGD